MLGRRSVPNGRVGVQGAERELNPDDDDRGGDQCGDDEDDEAATRTLRRDRLRGCRVGGVGGGVCGVSVMSEILSGLA